VAGFRKKLGEVMEGHTVQYLVLSLIMLDLVVVITEIFLEEHYKKCNESDHLPHWVEIAEEGLIYTSFSILIGLGLEVLLLLFAFGLSFFKHPLYILDGAIIALSITFEVVLRDAVGGLLVIFRLWRVVRIIHGVAMTMEERSEEKIAKINVELEELTKKMAALTEENENLHRRVSSNNGYGSEKTPLL